ncbi:hypothetical protein HDV03_003911 [Kappamyces sp. JEL0829]|nr:hypothetical protein HDV03_003911 [Kappamyces sp. JEL0829]
MISALQWIKRGAALNRPERSKLSDEEYERIQQEMGVQLQDAKLELEEAQDQSKEERQTDEATDEASNAANDADGQDLSIYNLDNYDDEDMPDPNETNGTVPMFANVRGLAYYENQDDDPYIKLGDEEDEEMDELLIEDTDNLLLACKTEDDVSHLEIYVYEEQEDNLYVHHDIMLPSFPLCLEWIDFPMGAKLGNTERPFGNYVAIGTFDPQVEIWDLDCVDAVFPEVILGKIPSPTHSAPKSTKSKHGPARVAKRPQAERHVDAVMAIAANRTARNLIATGSADTTVKLWDLNRPSVAVASYSHHTNKVQAVAWNATENTVLLTGAYDKTACAFDSRAPDTVGRWQLKADVECMKWDPFKAEIFYVSTEDGVVQSFDVRSPKNGPIFTLHAHDSAVSSLDLNPFIPGCLVTGSGDKNVKVWSLKEAQPKCLFSRDLDAGKVFSTTFSPDSPYTLAVAGSKGKVVIWNLEDNVAFKKAFPSRQFHSAPPSAEKPARREVLALQSDAEAESEDEEADEIMEGDYSDEEDGDHV